MTASPTVTVLIPARNEEADIERCLRAVLAQDHPHDRMEIVLVDGGSTDRTAETASDILSGGDVAWKIVENPVGTTPSNLNAGLAVATGEILCRVDARSLVPPEYVSLCADVLASRQDVVVTGGAQVAVAADSSVVPAGVARALNNRYAMGGSPYRSGASSAPSDTVYLGAFRTEELRTAGGWDEFFETNQDFELNRRMARKGTIWFDERLQVQYVPRRSILAVWHQYHRFGRWKFRYWRRTGDRPQRRQWLLIGGSALFVPVLLLALWRRPAATLVSASLAAIAIDEAGGGAPAPPAERALAAVTSAVVASAWLSGVVRESILGEHSCTSPTS